MAPEVFARSFSLPADMWSMGMLAYQAIANRCAPQLPPFNPKSPAARVNMNA